MTACRDVADFNTSEWDRQIHRKYIKAVDKLRSNMVMYGDDYPDLYNRWYWDKPANDESDYSEEEDY